MDKAFKHGRHGRLQFDEVVVGDTETTGLAPYGLRDGVPTNDPDGPDRLCSLAFVVLRRTPQGWSRGSVLSFLVDPCRSVPEGAARVNGFHWSAEGSAVSEGRTELRGQSLFEDRAEELIAFLSGRPLVFHNAAFDVAVLDAELERCGLAPLAQPVLCTKKAFSDILGLGRPSHYVPGSNLNALCDFYGLDRSARVSADGTDLHGAAVDRDMCARAFTQLEARGWMVAEDPASLPHRGLAPALSPAL